MANRLYVDGEYVGEVTDVKTVESLNKHHIEYIPPGNAEFSAQFTVYGDLGDWWRMFRLSDLEVFEEFNDAGGELAEDNFEKLNAVSYVAVVRNGEFKIATIVFKDGSVWTP